MIRIPSFYYVLLFMLCGLAIKAQTKATKETKVVVVLSADQAITALELFESDEDHREKLLERYADSYYFLGTLVGRYRLEGIRVIPILESTVKVFKEHELFSRKDFFTENTFARQEYLKLGNTIAMILENNKEELTVKISKDEK